ncbi:fungal-specific transcription factor domain-containing protein [Aspergillus pseudoustus]|uniref:Fungal-specific transcription factor domain-containing protein n=1 Tax=Aspergillus pseudoustus TaxID=1810923 RepID=A0ABR4K4G3_9EURO
MSPANAGETIEARRHRLSSVPRAVRCDRSIPCANCRAAKIACRQPGDKSSRQVQADRVANLQGIVERLERRLHSVESRLDTFEQPQPTSTSHALPSESHLGEGAPLASESARSACQADGSTTEQLLHALQNNIRISDGLSKSNFFFRKSASQTASAPQPLPASLVTCVLRRINANRPFFLSSYAVSDLSIVENLCQRVYSTSELASPGESASMHGVLFFILKEFIAVKDPLCQKFDLTTYLDHCEHNFVAAVETYEVLAVPSFENILALVMGMIKAQGEAKPYLYWKLVSAAITHCQSLEYHREATYRGLPSQKAEQIRRLFWTVYTFDKNMSLVLGRASFMQCVDIDAQYPTVSADPSLRAWDESFIMGIRLAEGQGRIFGGLYSPRTMIKDRSGREQLISELAGAMETWYLELKQINAEGVNGPEVYSLSRGNWEILFYSTQTLLFHASSRVGGEVRISTQCFAAAQNSLRAHLDVFPRYQEAQLLSDADYCNWILLSSSFVPFIVTFLHAIAAKDKASITLLEQVLDTLQTFRTSSRGSENLYQICSTFTHVARKLVSSHQWLPTLGGVYTHHQQQQQHQQPEALRVSDISQHPSLFEPEFFQDALVADAFSSAAAADAPTADDDFNMLDPVYTADILNEWLNGPPFPWERLDMELDAGNHWSHE